MSRRLSGPFAGFTAKDVAEGILLECHEEYNDRKQKEEIIPERKENDCRRFLIIENRLARINEAKDAFKIKSSLEIEEKILRGEVILNKDSVEIVFAKDYDDALEKVKHNWFDAIVDAKADTLPPFAHQDKMMNITLDSLQKGVEYMIIKNRKRKQ